MIIETIDGWFCVGDDDHYYGPYKTREGANDMADFLDAIQYI